jgi:hypothetical protein
MLGNVRGLDYPSKFSPSFQGCYFMLSELRNKVGNYNEEFSGFNYCRGIQLLLVRSVVE